MALERRNRRTSGLLWAGLAMIGAAVVLMFVTTLYAGRAGAYFSPAGMMGQGYGAPGWGAKGNVGSLPAARDAAEGALQSYANPDLGVTEVMEFSNNYYAAVGEKDSHMGAMELLVDKDTGRVYPEPGPNMMWNTKYGMMSGGRGMGGMMGGYSATNSDEKMSIAPERAVEIANDYLDRVSPGTRADEAEKYYGYYTLHTQKDGRITGMLSVNGYSGEVWYHSWHGPFVAMQEG